MAYSPETGYMGYVQVVDSTNIVRCTEISMNPHQEIKFYDHIIGRNDTIPTTLFGGKGASPNVNRQNILYRGSTKSYDGSIAFPLTENNIDTFLTQAINFTRCNLNIAYGCNIGYTFNSCYVDSYTLTINAGDIVSSSVNLKACSSQDYTPSNQNDLDPERIVTFDNVTFSGFTGAGEDTYIQKVDLSINNKAQYIYTNGNLNPLTVRAGIQEVIASISFYCPDRLTPRFVEDASNTRQDITITINGTNISLSLIPLYPELRGVTSGALIRTFKFVGVDMGIQ